MDMTPREKTRSRRSVFDGFLRIFLMGIVKMFMVIS
jgi:hypothetical protein